MWIKTADVNLPHLYLVRLEMTPLEFGRDFFLCQRSRPDSRFQLGQLNGATKHS